MKLDENPMHPMGKFAYVLLLKLITLFYLGEYKKDVAHYRFTPILQRRGSVYFGDYAERFMVQKV